MLNIEQNSGQKGRGRIASPRIYIFFFHVGPVLFTTLCQILPKGQTSCSAGQPMIPLGLAFVSSSFTNQSLITRFKLTICVNPLNLWIMPLLCLASIVPSIHQ